MGRSTYSEFLKGKEDILILIKSRGRVIPYQLQLAKRLNNKNSRFKIINKLTFCTKINIFPLNYFSYDYKFYSFAQFVYFIMILSKVILVPTFMSVISLGQDEIMRF